MSWRICNFSKEALHPTGVGCSPFDPLGVKLKTEYDP
jgi:hypothetical protein